MNLLRVEVDKSEGKLTIAVRSVSGGRCATLTTNARAGQALADVIAAACAARDEHEAELTIRGEVEANERRTPTVPGQE